MMRFHNGSRRRLTLAVAALASMTVAPPMASQGKPPVMTVEVPKVTYTRFSLPNGLVAVLHEDHSTPLVAVAVAYHVGSKDEPVGKRGFAHLFEHLMFEGTASTAPGELKRILQEAGGNPNAHTTEDETVFTVQAPSNMLETILWLEADRMAFLPSRFDSATFALERAAVTNEYRLQFDSRPVGALGLQGGMVVPEVLAGALYPEPSPYHVTPFGNIAELNRATLGDLRAFFDRYYPPNNATVVITGDFSSVDARKMIGRYFGGIPKRAEVSHPSMVVGPMKTDARYAVEDKVGNNRQLIMGWRTASTTNPDRPALMALSGILSGGANSRLGRLLINDRKMVTSVPASDNALFDSELAGFSLVVAAAAPNASLTDIEVVIDSVIADIRDHGVTEAELRKWANTFAVSSMVGMQPLGVRADLLEQGALKYGRPDALFLDAGRVSRLTPADIQRVARTYFSGGHVVLSVVPGGKLDQVSKPNLPYTNALRPITP